MPLQNSASFSDIIEPYYEANAQRRLNSNANPIALTQIGQMYYSLRPRVAAQEQITTHSRRRNIPNAPYPSPILRVNVRNSPEIPHQGTAMPHGHVTVAPPSGASIRDAPGHSVEPAGEDHDQEQDLGDDAPGSDDEDQNLIPKPEGEVGRPGRGGYSLERELKWDKKKYTKINKYIKHLVEEHLDDVLCYSLQALPSLKLVKDLAYEKFPELLEYKDGWPVSDMVRMRLKYSASRAKLASAKVDAEVGQKIRLGRRRA